MLRQKHQQMCGEPLLLYLDLKGVNHDLHQHLLVRQQAVQVESLTLYRLPSKQNTCLKKKKNWQKKVLDNFKILRRTLLRNMA